MSQQAIGMEIAQSANEQQTTFEFQVEENQVKIDNRMMGYEGDEESQALLPETNFYTQTLQSDEGEKQKKLTRRKQRKARQVANRRLWNQTLDAVTKGLFITGACGMIGIGLIRFSAVEMNSVHDVILNIYFLVVGIIIAASHMEFTAVQRNFRVLNYHWGRALLSFFLCSLSFPDNEQTFVQYLMVMYFFIVGCCYITLSIADRKHDIEQERIDDITALAYAHSEQEVPYGSGIIETAKAAKARAEAIASTVKNFATAYENNAGPEKKEEVAESYSTDYEGYASTAGSELYSDLDSDHENSKYGINALRRPFF